MKFFHCAGAQYIAPRAALPQLHTDLPRHFEQAAAYNGNVVVARTADVKEIFGVSVRHVLKSVASDRTAANSETGIRRQLRFFLAKDILELRKCRVVGQLPSSSSDTDSIYR